MEVRQFCSRVRAAPFHGPGVAKGHATSPSGPGVEVTDGPLGSMIISGGWGVAVDGQEVLRCAAPHEVAVVAAAGVVVDRRLGRR